VKLIIHKILVPILGIGGVIPLLPIYVSGAHSGNFHAEVTGEWRKVRNEELYNMYSLSRFLLYSSTEEG